MPTPLAGLVLVKRQQREDSRGFLSRIYCAEEFMAAGLFAPIAQINHTLTKRAGTVRGMHYQLPPHTENKLVSCLQGAIFDVAVDLRQESPSFLQWHGQLLSAANQRSFLIPEGFAHGFQALTEHCELIYLHTAPYCTMAEASLNAIDPCLAIEWPQEITERSERDRDQPMLDKNFAGIQP